MASSWLRGLSFSAILLGGGGTLGAGGCWRGGYDLLSEGSRDVGPPPADAALAAVEDAAGEPPVDPLATPDDGHMDTTSANARADRYMDTTIDQGVVDAPLPGDAGVDAPPDQFTAHAPCSTIPYLAAAPQIDGQLDPGPGRKPLTIALWENTGPGSEQTDLPTEFALAWRADGVYFFVHVQEASRLPANPGDPTWWGDSVEIYADDNGEYAAAPLYDNPGTSQLIVSAPDTATTSSARGEIYRPSTTFVGPWGSTTFGAFPTADGYVVEAFVQATDLGLASWTLSAGAKIGFDLAINYASPAPDAGANHRTWSAIYHVSGTPTGEPFRDANAFCTPTLLVP